MRDTLYIVMPAYNEEKNIAAVVREWYNVLRFGSEDSRMVIADGGSKDNTLQMLYDLQKEFPKLVVQSRPGTDHGTKVIGLYQYAIDQGADWVFQTDTDGQTDPGEFGDFWDLRQQYDAVIGNRTHRGDGLSRAMVEWVLRMYLLVYFGKMVPDANAPFRLMRTSVIDKYLHIMPEDFNLPNAVLTVCFAKFREKVTFLPVTFKPRQGGKNYMNFKRIVRIGIQSFHNFAEIRKSMKKAAF